MSVVVVVVVVIVVVVVVVVIVVAILVVIVVVVVVVVVLVLLVVLLLRRSCSGRPGIRFKLSSKVNISRNSSTVLASMSIIIIESTINAAASFCTLP